MSSSELSESTNKRVSNRLQDKVFEILKLTFRLPVGSK